MLKKGKRTAITKTLRLQNPAHRYYNMLELSCHFKFVLRCLCTLSYAYKLFLPEVLFLSEDDCAHIINQSSILNEPIMWLHANLYANGQLCI